MMKTYTSTDTKKMFVDIVIIGSGFAGSLLAHGLTSQGYRVAVLEQGEHPRFAIGESSTPVADLLLRRIAKKANLPWLEPLSRFGSWRKTYPELLCGRKRGFSYYFHAAGHDPLKDEFLVAASSDDELSDTQWYRADVDHFLVKKLQERGVLYLDRTTVQGLHRDSDSKVWNLTLSSHHSTHPAKLEAAFIIDATGDPNFSRQHFQADSSDQGFHTHTAALYTHFELENTWTNHLYANAIPTTHYPFEADYAALHHLLDEGWMWMLRFENQRVSTGLVFDLNDPSNEKQWNQLLSMPDDRLALSSYWTQLLSGYPSLRELFYNAKHATDLPSDWKLTKRLQRKTTQMSGPGWIQTHHTAGFVDPLHSTGIAFTLSGVERLLNLFGPSNNPFVSGEGSDGTQSSNSLGLHIESHEFLQRVQLITNGFAQELRLIDQLVAASIYSRHDPELFKVATMLYFIHTIHHEQYLLQQSVGFENSFEQSATLFLQADHTALRSITEEAVKHILEERTRFIQEGIKSTRVETLTQQLVQRLKIVDPIGLFEEKKGKWTAKSFIAHSAVELE